MSAARRLSDLSSSPPADAEPSRSSTTPASARQPRRGVGCGRPGRGGRSCLRRGCSGVFRRHNIIHIPRTHPRRCPDPAASPTAFNAVNDNRIQRRARRGRRERQHRTSCGRQRQRHVVLGALGVESVSPCTATSRLAVLGGLRGLGVERGTASPSSASAETLSAPSAVPPVAP